MTRTAPLLPYIDDFVHSGLAESGEHPIAFGLDRERGRNGEPEPARSPDDEITIEAPIPEIPESVPSPLGDDDAPATKREEPTLPPAAHAAPLRRHVSPADVRAAREAREAARRETARTRLIVLAIWGAAVLLAAGFALLALSG